MKIRNTRHTIDNVFIDNNFEISFQDMGVVSEPEKPDLAFTFLNADKMRSISMILSQFPSEDNQDAYKDIFSEDYFNDEDLSTGEIITKSMLHQIKDGTIGFITDYSGESFQLDVFPHAFEPDELLAVLIINEFEYTFEEGTFPILSEMLNRYFDRLN